MHPPLIEALKTPALYPHPVERVELIETHISWVLLAGDYAYKVRKPVDFGFLDFTTLEQRRRDCEEELRLNRRLAPSLYLGLVAIGGTQDAPRLGAQVEEAIEFAVRMRRFDQTDLLSHQQAGGRLDRSDIDRLAETLTHFHAQVPAVDPASDLGRPETLAEAIVQNFVTARTKLAGDRDARAQVARLEAQSREQLRALQPLLEARRKAGAVRECHGDLHLGNIVRYRGELLPFDCIEFNPAFRWIDRLNDLAFLLMDLEYRGEQILANRLLDRYLGASGDYGGVPLLPLFKAYRAMVRAKVALLTMESLGDEQRQAYQRYADLAEGYARPGRGRLILMHGVSGSGKSWLSERLAERRGAMRLRSDRERRRLFGDRDDRYSAEATLETYAHLWELTTPLLKAGRTVIVDATFLRADQRAPFLALAREQGVPVHLISCEGGAADLDARIRQRAQQGQDPSEATVAVRHAQAQSLEPLSEAELALTYRVNTQEPALVDRLAAALWKE